MLNRSKRSWESRNKFSYMKNDILSVEVYIEITLILINYFKFILKLFSPN